MLFKIKRETAFTIAGSVLSLILLAVAAYAIKLLIVNAKSVIISQDLPGKKEVVKFDIEGLKKLGIMK